MEFSEIQRMVHETAKSKGWYDSGRTATEFLLLFHTEISEATEALRKAPSGILYRNLQNFCEELADLVIRVMDFCEYTEIDLEHCILLKDEYNKSRSYRHGNKDF